ncbi:uncharacterized protein LOC129795044 [Lutzomyia longipalpis]|uniref:uncharacterized protein LOC129795044 n=1 Tax=Lutzomyia longipalpis TaxID=7200 RepID=UPI002483FE15|nr:uncharacterized protein LOC129795044 [Lutzomyia longipalpis]
MGREGRNGNGYNSFDQEKLDLPDAFSSPRSGDEVEADVDDPADLLHLLSNTVRQEYLSYLEKLLYSNYETWMICRTHDEGFDLNLEDLHACAKTLELKALKSSMIVNLYRKAMLKIISEIRQETQSKKLSGRLVKSYEKIHGKYCNAQTQTEEENFLIERYFRESLPHPAGPPSPKRKRKHPKKRKSHGKTKEEAHPVVQEEPQREKDEIEANLEKLFASETVEVDIFENPGDLDAHIKLVLSETKTLEPLEKSPKFPEVVEVNAQDTLRDSMWPCELRMRRKKLYRVMCDVGEYSLRRYERVKAIFGDLFGEDSDDEDCPPSPSTDMDAITLSSCRKRIAPTIVKHLMKPFNEGLIANRWLFKKLAKSLADSIVIENDYADDRYVRDFIDEYFAIHPNVVDVADIV